MLHCVTGWVTCCTTMLPRTWHDIWHEGMNVAAETTLYCNKSGSYSEFVQSQFSMFSQALSQALPLPPPGYCSNTLVYVSCGLDLPDDEVNACN